MGATAVGAYLRALRVASGHTQESVADALEVSQKQVWRWERGQSKPSATAIAAFTRLVNGSALHVERLILDPNATENDALRLAAKQSMPAPSATMQPQNKRSTLSSGGLGSQEHSTEEMMEELADELTSSQDFYSAEANPAMNGSNLDSAETEFLQSQIYELQFQVQALHDQVRKQGDLTKLWSRVLQALYDLDQPTWDLLETVLKSSYDDSTVSAPE